MLNTVNLTTANPLSVNSDWKNKSGLLSLGDSNDVYSLVVSKASSLNLNLSTIGAGNLFAIVRDGNGNNTIDDNEILLRSSQTSVIQNVPLGVGSYFIVADLTTLPTGVSTVPYEFGISYASQSKVLWRDTLNNNQVGFWDFTMTANGPQMTSTQLTWSGIDPGWKVEATGDINGDGVTDVLWRNTISNDVVFWEMDGAGNLVRYTPAASMLKVSGNWKVIGMGDMDGDGNDDVVWRNSTGQETVIWRMNGLSLVGGSYEFVTDMVGKIISVSQDWRLEQVADWNGDGKGDFFWRNQTSNEIIIWLMNGKQLQAPYFSLGALKGDQKWQIEGIGDVDANGTTDILWRHQTTGELDLWTMNRSGKRSGSKSIPEVMLPQNWQLVGMSDFTGDGQADVAWRDRRTGKFVLWGMNGLDVQQRYDLESADFTMNRQAVAVGQKRSQPLVPLTFILSAESDTGISNSDGITKNRIPNVTGTATPGEIITLYANSTIVGSTTVANNGNWDITSQELSDGNYDLSVEIRTLSGQVIKRSVKSVVIDTVAPDVTVSGILEGIDWKSTDQLNALIADRGVGLSNVTYQVDGQSPIGWTGTNGTWTKSAGDLLNWNDTNQQGVHTLTLKALDKAGNEQQQTIGFSVAKPLIWLDTDVWTDDPTPSNPSQPDGLTAPPPAESGGSGGGMAQYGWGADGQWGYSYGGSWYSSGISDPQRLIGTPWLPSGGNLNSELMNYRIRLQTILKTAIAVIPNTSAENQTKRAALKNRVTLLIEAGAYLNGDSADSIYYGYEGGGFNTNYYWQDKFFHGSLRSAMDQSINTVAFGVALAKDLMMGSDSVRLLTFQTLVETTIGAAHLATNNFSPSYTNEIQQSARELAKTYGLLKPQGTMLTGRFAWLDKLWDLTETPSTSGTAIRQILFGNNSYGAGGIVGEVVAGMNELAYDYNYNRDAGMFQLLQMSDRLLKSASTIGGWRSDLETTEFTQALLNFGYEVVKVNPTVDSTNLTEVSTWLETLLEGGDVRMSAAGMNDFLSGVQGRSEKIKTLEYSGKLLKVAEAVDDVKLDKEMLKATTLSKLLNFGGSYSALNTSFNGNSGLFLDTLNAYSISDVNISLIKARDELTIFSQASTAISNTAHFFDFQTKILRSISRLDDSAQLSRSASFLKNLTFWGTEYYQDYNDEDETTTGFDPFGYFQEISAIDGQWILKKSIMTVFRTAQLRAPTNDELNIVLSLTRLAINSKNDRSAIDSASRFIFADSVEKSRDEWFKSVRKYETDDIPNRLKAITWGLLTWSTNARAYAVGATIPSFGQAVREFSGSYTCNRFVGDAYAIGAGVGYGVNGQGGTYPTGQPFLLDPRPGYPVDANELASDKNATGILKNLPLTNDPKMGDIISFEDPEVSHTGLVFGNRIYLSARSGNSIGDQAQSGVMITFIPYRVDNRDSIIRFRVFRPN